MIKANELKIGNLVEINLNKKIVDVESIKHDGINLTGGDGYGVYATFDFNEINPIPLTEEWLFKFGFYENRTGNPSWQLDVNLGFCIWGRLGKGFNVYVNSDEIGNPILYVHQLQNLYFALTGQELTIKQ